MKGLLVVNPLMNNVDNYQTYFKNLAIRTLQIKVCSKECLAIFHIMHERVIKLTHLSPHSQVCPLYKKLIQF